MHTTPHAPSRSPRGTTLQLQSLHEWKFYGMAFQGCAPLKYMTNRKKANVAMIFLSHMMLLGNPQSGAKVAHKLVVLICLAMRAQHRDAQALLCGISSMATSICRITMPRAGRCANISKAACCFTQHLRPLLRDQQNGRRQLAASPNTSCAQAR